MAGAAAAVLAASGALQVAPPSAVDTSFTGATGGAAEAQLYDRNDATIAFDPAGITAATHAAFAFASPKSIGRVRAITAAANGFSNAIVFNIQYSDTSLTTGFTTADTLSLGAGLAQLTDKQIGNFGAHLYWRIIYASGTTGGNAWLGELTMYAR